MALTATLQPSFFKALLNKEIDFDSDTIKAILLTSSYTPDVAHDYKNDLTNEVANGNGYTTGGFTLTGVSMAVVLANAWSVARANSTAYVAGDIVKPASGNGFLYRALTSGTSGGSVPTYPTTIGGTVVDGGVTWECVGRAGVVLDGSDAVWDPATITARYCALVDVTPGTDATRPIIGLVDFGVDKSSEAGPFTIAWAAVGIAVITVP
jgi:hypothetical protein